MMPHDSSLDFKLVKRVCLLQQALDQALESLHSLKQQVEHHQLLESQLAQTEKYSNVQQKIIANLQQQLTERGEWQARFLKSLLAGVQDMVEHQQLELERLRVRIQQSQIEVQDYLIRLKNYYQQTPLSTGILDDLELTTEVMVVRTLTVSLGSQLQAAQQHIQALDQTLTRHQVNFARMQTYLEGAAAAVDSPGRETDLIATDVADAINDPVALRALVQAQRQKLMELNEELSTQFHQQTRLKYRCQELAAERDHAKQQTLALQQENAALQEQILHQADQAQEYEAAVHYWKQRCSDALAYLPPSSPNHHQSTHQS